MKQTKLIMGMPITIDLVDAKDTKVLSKVFDYFRQVDARFSPYKKDSELSKLNNGLIKSKWSKPMREVIELCDQTKLISSGFFDINRNGVIDTSGLVKGWAINNAAKILDKLGFANYYIEAGGDIQLKGHNKEGNLWSVGIRNPFNINEIVKVLSITNHGVATSGTYLRGEHIYNPISNYESSSGIKSLSVIGPNIYEADRFATAAFAMGKNGIVFIESLPGFECYMIDEDKTATYTKGFDSYVAKTV